MMEIATLEKDKYPEKKDFHLRNWKTLKQSLGKLLGRRTVTITEYDPIYKVVYLGNVLTGWAKGDSCTEKPLTTLWKNYTCNSKPDVQMKLTITQSGLKAITKEHGLTEYWSHRVTYCCAPRDLPRIFCWVYRHEGRKLKQELRCHAVLCSKESVARLIATQLQARLTQALIEFKRDKISRQNARLSLANCVYENPSMPRRKILLSTGCHNYRPPLERSKSAPKLMAIEEEESLEDEEDDVFISGTGSSSNAMIPNNNNNTNSRRLHSAPPVVSATATAINTTTNTINKATTVKDSCGFRKPHRRNLTYSNRGGAGKFGGLNTGGGVGGRGIGVGGGKENDRDSSQNNNRIVERDVVEENPFGPESDLLNSIDEALQLRGIVSSSSLSSSSSCNSEAGKSTTNTIDEEITIIRNSNNNNNNNNDRKFVHRNSWAAGEKLCSFNFSTTTTSTSGCYSDYDGPQEEEEEEEDPTGLPNNRDNVFVEDHDGANADTDQDNKTKEESTTDFVLSTRNFERYQVRPMLKSSEGILLSSAKCDDEFSIDCSSSNASSKDEYSADSASNSGKDEYCAHSSDVNSYCFLDDESMTPSLQSISSGSDYSSMKDSAVLGKYAKNYDLDSLWEEGSDESGYVESCDVATDDKIRDIPHHQLMRNCLLTTASKTHHCLEV